MGDRNGNEVPVEASSRPGGVIAGKPSYKPAACGHYLHPTSPAAAPPAGESTAAGGTASWSSVPDGKQQPEHAPISAKPVADAMRTSTSHSPLVPPSSAALRSQQPGPEARVMLPFTVRAPSPLLSNYPVLEPGKGIVTSGMLLPAAARGTSPALPLHLATANTMPKHEGQQLELPPGPRWSGSDEHVVRITSDGADEA